MQEEASQPPAERPNFRIFGFRPDPKCCSAVASDETGATRLDGIKEGDIVQNGAPRGVRMHRVVLVRLAVGGQYAVYFRRPGKSGYVPFIKKDGRSLRIWSDFDRVQQFCSRYMEYQGAYLVVPEGYWLLSRLGIPAQSA